MSKHLGIKVKFVDYLSADVHGKLLPREKRILINAHKPRNEHVYTLLHELGHFVMHVTNRPRKYHPRFLDFHWKALWLGKLCSKIRRYYRFIFNKTSGKEWEADLWAMCAFVALAQRIGCRDELLAFLDRHPEKRNIFRLVAFATIYGNTKSRIKRFCHVFTLAFREAS